MNDHEFLDLSDLLLIHEEQLREFGGSPGVRDPGLIESAIAQPRAQFGGEWLHRDLAEMAAAYFYHLIRNHGFIDGNKRVGVVAAVTFLWINGFVTTLGDRAMERLALDTAAGRRSKQEIADRLRPTLRSRAAG